MRKDFGVRAWTYPQPVFILATYNQDGTPNAMNAAWGGVSGADELTICVGARHKTAENIQARKAFTVAMGDLAHVVACDYVGVVSGHQVPNKVERAGFHVTPSALVDAPILEELPMTVECQVVSYDPKSGRLVGKIVNITANEEVLGADGTIDPSLLQPIFFDPVHNAYYSMGEKVGNAFQDGKALIK